MVRFTLGMLHRESSGASGGDASVSWLVFSMSSWCPLPILFRWCLSLWYASRMGACVYGCECIRERVQETSP